MRKVFIGEYWRFIEAFSRSYDLAPLPLPLRSVSSTGHTQEDWERGTTCWRERGWGRSQTYGGEKAWPSLEPDVMRSKRKYCTSTKFRERFSSKQGCGSGSIFGRLDPDPGGPTCPKKEKWINLWFSIAGCSFVRARGFCSLNVLHRGLEVNALNFWSK